MPADSEVAERADAADNTGVRVSARTVVALLLILGAVVAYTVTGFAYAASVSYQTPGGTWLESLLNLGIRVVGWPLLLATQH